MLALAFYRRLKLNRVSFGGVWKIRFRGETSLAITTARPKNGAIDKVQKENFDAAI
jgi:hypothetical protein